MSVDSSREHDLCSKGVIELARLFRTNQTTPSEAVQLTLQRMSRLNPTLHAFLSVAEDAVEAANTATDQLGRGVDLGPLHGIPVSVKDNMDIQGMRTTAASRVLMDAEPAAVDAAVVKRLRASGAVVIGKTNLTEFAVGEQDPGSPFPNVQNPRAIGHRAGSSSNGAAAAVASGLGVIGLGTDTGGSVRHPASVCGVVGLKPTYGLIPIEGIIPISVYLDHVGILARSVSDCAFGLDAVAGFWPSDPYSLSSPREEYASYQAQPLRGLRVGRPTNACFAVETADSAAAVAHVMALLEAEGSHAVEVIIDGADEADDILEILMPVDMVVNHQKFRGSESMYGRNILDRMAPGHRASGAEYGEARLRHAEMRRAWTQLFERIDVAVLPANLIGAPRFGVDKIEVAGTAYPVKSLTNRFNRAANLTGFPAITIPVAETAEGLPLGIQLIGPWLGELRLLAIAELIERRTGNLAAKWDIDLRHAAERPA